MTATVAALVCTRPLASVSGTRCTRCTPLSNFIRPNTPAPGLTPDIRADGTVRVAPTNYKAAIEAFWNMAMPNGIHSFTIRESHPSGDSCANVVTLSNKLPDGTIISTDCVAVYTANDAGKIVSLRAYWDFSKLAAQLEKMAARERG